MIAERREGFSMPGVVSERKTQSIGNRVLRSRGLDYLKYAAEELGRPDLHCIVGLDEQAQEHV